MTTTNDTPEVEVRPDAEAVEAAMKVATTGEPPAADEPAAKPKAKAAAKADKPVDPKRCRGGFETSDPTRRVECKKQRASASNSLCADHSAAYRAGTFRISATGLTKLVAMVTAGEEVAYGKRAADAPDKPRAVRSKASG
jgi:hypothetical protein